MANIKGKDADGSDIYLKASGAGTNLDPHVQETLDSNSAAILADTANIDTNIAAILADTANIDTNVAAIAAGVTVSGSALPTGASTSANQSTIIGHVDSIEALLGTIDADTGAIDTKLGSVISGSKIQADVISLPSVTVAEKVLLPPLQGTIATSDDNSILDISAASGYTSGDYFVFSTILIQNNSATDTTVLVKSGSSVLLRVVAPAKGDGILHSFPADARLKGGANQDIFLNLSGANSISYSILGYLEQ